MSIRVTHGIALLGACALWACSKGGNAADSAAAADSTARANAAAAPAPTPAPATLTDANIAALLDEANMADSAGGDMASKKGTAGDVKSFGRDMMRDHHALRKAGQDLAKKLSLTPAAPAGDTVPTHAQKMGDSLNAMAKGAAWDKAYIDHEVAMHQGVLAIIQQAQGAAQDTSLKALLTKAQPNIEAHLKKAQDVQSKLNSAPAAGGAAAGGAAKADSGKKKP